MKFPERPTCHKIDSVFKISDSLVWGRRDDGLRHCSYCGSVHPQDLLSALNAGAKLGGADWKYGWPHKFYVEGIPNPNAGNREVRGSTSIKDEELRAFFGDVLHGSRDREFLARLIFEDPAIWERSVSLRSAFIVARAPERVERFVSLIRSAALPGMACAETPIEKRAVERMRLIFSEPWTSDWTPCLISDPVYDKAPQTRSTKWYNEHLKDDGFDLEALTTMFDALEKHAGIRFEITVEGLRYAAPHAGYQR